MANQLLTIGMITREALALFRNSNSLLRNIDTQYSSDFAQSGAKIGSTLRIRLPVDYTLRTGPTAVVQSTLENQTTLTVTSQLGVDMGFSSADYALSLDDFSERYIAPAVNTVAGGVAVQVMNAFDGGTGQGGAMGFIHQVDGNNNTITPTASTWLQAGAYLDRANADRGRNNVNRMAIIDPNSQARTVAGLAGFFNPQDKISDQTETGLMTKNMLGANWYMDQTVLQHTAGSQASGTVNGANQTGQSLIVAALTGTLAQGDVITIAGVFNVNRVTKQSTNTPQQFMVTAPVPAGSTLIPIYPAITPAAGGPVQYQTVQSSPANGAAWTLATNASETFRKNILFHPKAVTLATVDLPLPDGGVVKASRQNADGISLRIIEYYNGTTDQFSTRLDILFGVALLRPEWVVAVADAI